MIQSLHAAGFLSDLDLHFARTMGRIAGETDEAVLLSAALASRFTFHGHICVDLLKLSKKTVENDEGEVVEGFTWPKPGPWIRALKKSPLVKNGPLVLEDDGRIYLTRYFHYQQRLVQELKERIAVSPLKVEEADEQAAAARTAAENRFALISGGPGTGKTYTVVKILILLLQQWEAREEREMRILLAAPTGKAAARLEESIRKAKQSGLACTDAMLKKIPDQAHTLHSILKPRWDKPTRFTYDKDHPLPVDLLVVDEASMIDLALMTKLLEATPPEARLILLGDPNQLASVEAGAVLGDLCRAKGAMASHVAHLERSYRFTAASGIGRLAEAFLEGDGDRALRILKDEAYPDVELIQEDEEEKRIKSWVRKNYGPFFRETDPEEQMHRFSAYRILCALRSGPRGLHGMNRRVKDLLGVRRDQEWYPGRPVLIRENDYLLNLFNGDVGIMGQEGKVCFPGKEGGLRFLTPSRLPHLDTVFAMTIHQSQGSEFDHLLLMLPEKRSPLISRELLYTAATRARESLVLAAPEEMILEAAATPIERASGIKELL